MKYFIYILIFIFLFSVAENATAQTKYEIQYSSTCVGTSIIFNSNVFEIAQFPDSIVWNFGDAASGLLNTANGEQQPVHIYNTPGSYTVTLHVVDAGAGTINLIDTIVVVNPIAYNFGPDVFLCGDTGTYVLNAPIIPNATYLWNDDTLTKGPVLIVNQSGDYTVKINGCPVTDTVGVYFTPKPNLDLGKDHVLCSGEKISLDASNENATYQWQLNGTVLNTTASQVPVVAPGGQYIATINAQGCGIFSDTVNITFSNYAAPPFYLGPDTLLCPKEIFSLTAHVTGATAYAWSSKGLGVSDKVSYNIGTDSTITITNQGRYWAFVTVTNQCEVVDTMIVKYRGDKQLNFNDTALCQGGTLVLNADFGTGVYKWGSIPPQRDDQNNTNQSTYYVYKPGFYTITATVGHCVFKDSLHVVFNDTLKMALPKDTTLCQGENFIIHPVANTTNYIWQDSSKTPTFTATQTGQYSITATNGCGSDTATMNIVFEPCPCGLLLPNAFTPNSDGVNDNFRPLHACDMDHFSMDIFNRYGEKVYATNNPLQGWNGRIKGNLQSMGAYVWMVTYTKTSTKQIIKKQGTVLLLK